MKKKLIPLILALVCAIACVFGLTACGKELNYLKADSGDGQLKSEFDFGTFSADELNIVKEKLSTLTFYYEYYPDKSTEKADMSKVEIKYFYSDGQGGTSEGKGLPETLIKGTGYTLYYYYVGHEPTADFSDAMCVRIGFFVSDN